jgi:endonuclease YncB( thermonuclease family)
MNEPAKKRRQLGAALVLLLAFSLVQYLGDSPPDFDLTGRVVRIADGDTLSILDATNTQHKVRLYGIDTPERDQPFGNAAKKALMQLVDEKPVGVVVITTDSYGRKVGTLYQQGVNINVAMVASGYAWWYQHYAPHERTLAASEQQARAHGLGLWAAPHPVPPWDWRRGQR